MKFGPLPVAEAEGAILAHSLQLPSGRLRKGVFLDAGHISALHSAGFSEVTVARLETDDVHEDEAADFLARALAPGDPQIHLSEPFTGRVNLIADAPGVVMLDAQKITQANAIDPMITLATVPDGHQIHPGGMIATVKIISYAVPTNAIKAAASFASEAVRLATPVYKTASLIVTTIEGGPGRKGTQAVENRLSGLGIALSETVSCAHSEAALSAAIASAQGEIVLILTASATSDLRDTAPAALRQAGGQVHRFGLPVDPGNLLFLGRWNDKPVIGLPGSVRSPVLHGADWVLARVACGIDITDLDFAAMGVGGLLKEIPTRPQPRQR